MKKLLVSLAAGLTLALAAFAIAEGNPCNPCSKKADNPCSAKAANPCAAKAANPCAAKPANPCNPCAAKAAANPCNPCNAKKAAANPCNPCNAKKGAANPCNPCNAKSAGNPCSAKAANPCNPCSAAKAASNVKVNSNLDSDGVGLKGYDPVSYFDSAAPVKGDASITEKYEGVTYRFSNHENHNKFTANPSKYAPQYGGWCATAMAYGRKVDIDPLNFKISNGHLLVFYKSLIQNAINDWNKDESGLTVKANNNWKDILAK